VISTFITAEAKKKGDDGIGNIFRPFIIKTYNKMFYNYILNVLNVSNVLKF
jgi:hypothetical protein